MRIALLVAAVAVLHAQENDLGIVRKADQLLSSEAVWNRHDTRECPAGAKLLSLYCALEKAIVDSGRQFEHRATVMEQVRLTVELAAPNAYEHRLMGYNNDPDVTFADMKRMLRLAELRMSPDAAKAPSTVKGRLVHNGSPVAAPWGVVPKGEWTDYEDRLAAEWLQRQGIMVSVEVAGQAVQTAARDHPFHPVKATCKVSVGTELSAWSDGSQRTWAPTITTTPAPSAHAG
jgi:hypothetical protein